MPHKKGLSPNDEQSTATIVEAYNDLSTVAFAVWIRLMVSTPQDLAGGRSRLGRILRYGPTRFNSILRELRFKGYVEADPCHGKAAPVLLKKRAMLVGRDSFVKLSSLLSESALIPLSETSSNPVQRVKWITKESVASTRNLATSASDKHKTGGPSPAQASRMAKDPLVAPSSHAESGGDFQVAPRGNTESHSVNRQENILSTSSDGEAESSAKATNQEWQKLGRPSQENIGENDPISAISSTIDHNILTESHSHVSLKRMNEEKKKKKEEKKRERARKSEALTGSAGTDPNFSKLERSGSDPSMTFALSDEERTAWCEVLKRPPANPDKKRLVKRLGEDFARLYARYRLQLQPSYTMMDTEKKHAEAAGVGCVLRGVTPRQLIEYWHKRIGNFTDLRFPPLAFLAAPGRIDECACSVTLPDSRKPGRARSRSSGAASSAMPVDALHGYADPSKLDPRVRPGLMAAGFDLSDLSDAYLLTVQAAARASASGVSSFVSSKLRPMVNWIVVNLLKKEE